MTVCRAIINQAHAIANGGNFGNGLPFSLTMGCGTWDGNRLPENLHYRLFMNTARIVRVIPPREPTPDDIFTIRDRPPFIAESTSLASPDFPFAANLPYKISLASGFSS